MSTGLPSFILYRVFHLSKFITNSKDVYIITIPNFLGQTAEETAYPNMLHLMQQDAPCWKGFPGF